MSGHHVIGHLTDLHILEGARFAEHRRVFEEVIGVFEAMGVTLVAAGGDTYGHRTGHRSSPAEQAVYVGGVRRMAASATWVQIPGNHEAVGELDTIADVAGEWPIYYTDRAKAIKAVTPAGPVTVYACPYPTAAWLATTHEGVSWDQLRAEADGRLAQLLNLWRLGVASRRAVDLEEPQLLLTHANLRGSRTSGGEVMAHREIELAMEDLNPCGFDLGLHGHIHLRQWMGPDHVISGSPWFNTHGEEGRRPSITVAEVWRKGLVRDLDLRAQWPGMALEFDGETPGGLRRRVWSLPTSCQPFVTLTYEWGKVGEGYGWRRRPSASELGDIRGADVRARLIVDQDALAACPWGQALAELELLGAAAVAPTVKALPTVRVRSEEVGAAVTLPDKLRAFWACQDPPPDERVADDALALLGELQRYGEGFPDWLASQV